ncbi:hypothetical protein ACT16_18740 [Mycobacterium heckeshornense]|nr:hypothetical protein ACT16_18740 [Mycobacterium heckeshornense]
MLAVSRLRQWLSREAEHRACARLGRRSAPWRRRCLDLEVELVSVHDDICNYLSTNVAALQLLVIGACGSRHVRAVVGAAGSPALGHLECVVPVVGHRHL